MQQLLIFIGKFQNRFLLEIQDLSCVVVKGLPCGVTDKLLVVRFQSRV